jgi:hypothetical protein
MLTATIAAGASLSGAVDCQLGRVRGLVLPAVWDTAALTFQVSADGVTYKNLYDNGGTEVNFTVAAGRAVGIDHDKSAILGEWRYLKIRSGTSGTPVNQTAEAIITVWLG